MTTWIHLAADTAACIFKETVIGGLIPQVVEPAIYEEMINAAVVNEVVIEITDALVETLHDVGHFMICLVMIMRHMDLRCTNLYLIYRKPLNYMSKGN